MTNTIEKILRYIRDNAPIPSSIATLKADLDLTESVSEIHEVIMELKNEGVIYERMGSWYLN